jgi:hypothetical protein
MNAVGNVAAAVGLIISGLWLALVVATRLWYRYSTCQPLLFRSVRHAARYTTLTESIRAADKRREAVDLFLREFREGNVPVEFLEVPPTLEMPRGWQRRFGEDSVSAAWHASRLRLQLRRDRHLLIERVVDALVCLYRAERITADTLPITVRLDRIPRRAGKGLYPWRAVLMCTHPDELCDSFKQYAIADSIGIGVDVVKARVVSQQRPNDEIDGLGSGTPAPFPSGPSTPIVAHARCQAGADGMLGVVGGLLRQSDDQVFAVTCKHVLSAESHSRTWPTQPATGNNHEYTQDSPDIALLTVPNPCFVKSVEGTTPVAHADISDLEAAVQMETMVVKRPKRDWNRGVVNVAMVSGFKLGKHFYRGIHFQIAPYFFRRFWIMWPLSRRFSVEGDSGSWVINSQSGDWMGIVIGGYQWPNTITIALSSEYVLDAIQNSSLAHGRLHPEAFLREPN